jgi:hypothetical protein
MGGFMNFWDQQFSVPEFRCGQQPNRFLQEQAVRLKPPEQVLLDEGSGHQGLAYLTRYITQRTLTLENS